MLLKSQWLSDEVKEETKNYLDTNDNENTMIKNLWEAMNSISNGKKESYGPGQTTLMVYLTVT